MHVSVDFCVVWNGRPANVNCTSHYSVQVAALAPLALLLVLEARCAHFVIAHFNNFFGL